MSIFDELSLAGLIPVIKIDDPNDAYPLCAALKKGGLPVAEITFRTKAAEESIRRVSAELPGVLLGAGTVLTVEQAKVAVNAGARYIVSPGLNPKVVAWCVENGVPVLPGCANPTDIETALDFGLKTVKFFPAEALGGLKLIKAMSAPYGDISFVPTGGISEKNILEYLSFNKVKAVGGSWITPSDAIKAKDWARITKLTKSAVNLLLDIKIKHIGINSSDAETALDDATALSRLLNWEISDREKAIFVGEGFEVMKISGRGKNGHIALSTNNVERAMYHMKARGFEFEDEPVTVKDGKIAAIYLKNDVAGFAVHIIAEN